jgi:ribonuclease BN (tRNA processing enzyme)
VPDEQTGRLAAWLVTDPQAELIADIRRRARDLGVVAQVAAYTSEDFEVTPLPVEHTSHETWGYRLRRSGRSAVWAPEFATFPSWAAGADLMFAEGASWSRPIRFRGGVGGHAAVLETARAARDARVGRLVFAHLGRPTIRALDAGASPPFGEIGIEGADYEL